MSFKSQSLTIKNNLSVNGILNFSEGYQQLNNEGINSDLPANSYMGTSLESGNILRNNYTMTTLGPILFNETGDDKKLLLQKYPEIVKDTPVVVKYPFLYPLSSINNWSSSTQTIINGSNADFPITKCLGKGIGEISIHKVANPINGSPELQPDLISVNNANKLAEIKPGSSIIDNPIYPFNGYIQSGTIVQLISQENNGIKETVVIPYQSGRGVPLYASNFSPILNFEEESSRGVVYPFGLVLYPDLSRVIPTISPGIESQNCAPVLGVVLDSYSSQNFQTRNFKPQNPDMVTDYREPWYNFPAPFTIPPSSYKLGSVQGFFSPGPNSGSSFYAPWPKYFSYKSGDPVPVLTKGVTTVRIGAAYNIAQMTYSIDENISPTNKSWVPIEIIPLFQGETLEAGSTVYVCAKGNIQTGGPYYVSNGVPTYFNETNQFIGQTVWDVNIDTTWGNIGWTSTPGICFSAIPDEGVDIIQTRQSPNFLPYLIQSNQGTIIVQAVTTVAPSPGIGNPLDTTTDPQLENKTEQELYQINLNRHNLPGISGRATLSQLVPEKAVPIGILMETITGTGKWDYSGLPVNPPLNYTSVSTFGGTEYNKNLPVSNIPTRTCTGAGSGLEVSYTIVNSNSPYFGQITSSVSITDPGTGYIGGDSQILTIQDNTLAQYGIPQWKGNNATYIGFKTVPGTIDSLVPSKDGSGYENITANFPMSTYNLTQNNLYISFTRILPFNELNRDVALAPTASINEYGYDFSYYDEFTVFRVIAYDVPEGDQSIFQVVSTFLDGTDYKIETTDLYTTSVYIFTGYKFFETEICNYNKRAPTVNFDYTNGIISNIEIIDYGAGNNRGDILLILNKTTDYQLSENATITFEGKPPGYQEIVIGCPGYESSGISAYECFIGQDDPVATTIGDLLNDPLRIEETGEFLASFTRSIFVGSLDPIIYTQVPEYYDGTLTTVDPMYHSRRFYLIYKNDPLSGSEYVPVVGGTNYIPAINVATYNLTANSLRLHVTLENGVFSAKLAEPVGDSFAFLADRYTFNATTGTAVRLMSPNLETQLQCELILVENVPGNIVVSVNFQGGSYDLPDGDYYFQTQRTDQVNPTVIIETTDRTLNPDITTDRYGSITKLKLSDPGENNQPGDLIVVTQENSDLNCIFIYNNNLELIDLPPFAKVPGYNVDTSDEAWVRYNNVMQSAVNLLDKQVLIEVNGNQPSDYMDNVMPNAQQVSTGMPSNENVYKSYY